MKKRFTVIALFVLFKATAQNELYNNGSLFYVSAGATINVKGSFTNTATGADLQNNGIVAVTGNVTNNQAFSGYSGKLNFNGTTPQTLSGTNDFLTQNFEINNAAGAILNTKLKVNGTGMFTNGILLAGNASYPLWFTSSATTNGASDASHVNGYVVKEGTGLFTYPVGDATRYQQIDVNPSVNTSGLQVKYYSSDAGTAPFTGGTPLLYYNKLEYWDVTPLSTATGVVAVYWDNYNNVGINNVSDLRVAHKSAGSWLNEGAAGSAGTISAGSITSNSISSWSPLTLGSIANMSTLPLKWLSFTGRLDAQNKPLLNWRVSEQNVLNYTIEKSSDGNKFTNVFVLNSKGDGENEYFYEEETIAWPIVYYRLKQTDINGSFSYSPVISFQNHPVSGDELSVYPLPFRGMFTVRTNKTQTASLVNEKGQLVRKIQLNAGNNYVQTQGLSNGLYFLTLQNGLTQKLIKQ